MLSSRFVACIFCACSLVLDTGFVFGQAYPNKPIRIVAPLPGGSGDLPARLIAQGISGPLGQPVIVDNRAAIVAIDIVLKAPPDGYTMILYSDPLWLTPFLSYELKYDPVKEFSPITLVASSPNVLVVHPSVSANTVKELIALARAKPGALNYGSAPPGGSTHLGAELFKAMAGVNIVWVPYKGSGPALTGLVSGEVQLMFASGGSAMTLVNAGKLKALGVASARPSVLTPGLPTIAASGLPGYEMETNIGLFVQGKTPVTIVSRLNQETVRVLNRSDVKERLLNSGLEVVASSPEQLAAAVKSSVGTFGKLIKDLGIRSN